MDHTVQSPSSRARATRSAPLPALGTCLALAALVLTGCSTLENVLSGDKVDYRSATNRTSGLEVPPDLTQLSRDSRYTQPTSSGSVAASTFQTQGAGMAQTPTAPAVAPSQLGAFKLEKLGNERWISTTLPPDAVFPQVRAFWKDNGFNLVTDRPEAGVLETDWAENRARLPNDIIRNTIGRVFDSAFSTSQLDKYRTRIERNGTGTDIYVTHRGMAEVYVGERKEQTTWQTRPAEPELESEFLARLMVKLGGREEQARTLVQTSTGAAAGGPVRARTLADRPGPTLQVDDGFDRAWRRVGLALDRTGFTVEDRDRAQGLYFVRYVNPQFAGREEPSWLSRVLRFGRAPAEDSSPLRYRVKVAGDGAASSTVAVLDPEGRPATNDSGRRIAALLLDDLK